MRLVRVGGGTVPSVRTKADIPSRRLLAPADREAIEEIKQPMAAHEQAERDPLARRLHAAPLDDEPVTAADLDAIRDAHEDIAACRCVSLEELRRELA
jgi:hypothetical protein